MAVRLPHLASGPLSCAIDAFFQRMKEIQADGTFVQGYVRSDYGASDGFLFLHQGKAHCAGELFEDRFAAHSIAEFLERLPRAKSASWWTTDLPLFLCTAVLFRKAPSAQVPLDLVDAEMLLKAVRETEKDAVLVLRRGDDRHLAFCRNGELVALYPVDEEFPKAESIADRIVEYVLSDPKAGQTTLDIYDDIHLSPTMDAGRTLEEYRAQGQAQPHAHAPSLVVRLGARVAFHFPVTQDEVTIGRGAPNVLSLDNLSVSRHHAILRRRGQIITIEDLESENGLVVRGKRMKHVELRPGDEVKIGKYTVAYPRYLDPHVETAKAPAPSLHAEMDPTVSDKLSAIIEHKGKEHAVKGVVFNIGTARNAHLRISGMFLAAIHVQIALQPDGKHRITHLAGSRPVRLGGKRIKSETIKDGDEFTIGPHTFVYRFSG
jgi:hypothetical protein